jgi:hypothetical protein
LAEARRSRRMRWPTAIQMPISRVWLLTEWAIAEIKPHSGQEQAQHAESRDSWPTRPSVFRTAFFPATR